MECWSLGAWEYWDAEYPNVSQSSLGTQSNSAFPAPLQNSKTPILQHSAFRVYQSPPNVTGTDVAPHPTALCACTRTVQFGPKSTTNDVVNVAPETVFVSAEPPPSLGVMVMRYWSIGLSPGFAADQFAMSVSVVPGGSRLTQCAVTFVGAEGSNVATGVVSVTGAEAGLTPLTALFTTVI